jgi:asparagine synthetase B (glutamine-hydrolysing)
MVPSERIAKVVRRRLIVSAKAVPVGQPVAVALSGGVDSTCVLAALLAAGHRPTVVSYTPDARFSTDFIMAAEAAQKLELEFVPAVVNTSAKMLSADARIVIGLGYRGKVEVECLTPLVTIVGAAMEAGCQYLFTGDQADGYFANSKWASHNMERSKGVPRGERTNVQQDTDPARIDELRERYYRLDKSCSEGVKRIGARLGVKVRVPFRDGVIRDSFTGTTWRQVNRPVIKAPLHLAFPELVDSVIPTRPLPVNLHKGDSHFAEDMGRILLEAFPGPWRTARGLYAAIGRGEA